MRKRTAVRAAALLMIPLLLGGCGNSGGTADASAMKLTRTEGEARVTDENKQDKPIYENMNLYSGYAVDTEAESFAWIDLDAVKLLELDQQSRVEITKEDRHLRLTLESGGMFFCVERLEADESLEIKAASIPGMSMAVRGTSGLVRILSDTEAAVLLLEGRIEGAAGTDAFTVEAGRYVALAAAEGGVTVTEDRPIDYESDIPGFVFREAAEEPRVQERLERSNDAALQGWLQAPAAIAPFLGTWQPDRDNVAVLRFTPGEDGLIVTTFFSDEDYAALQARMEEAAARNAEMIRQDWEQMRDELYAHWQRAAAEGGDIPPFEEPPMPAVPQPVVLPQVASSTHPYAQLEIRDGSLTVSNSITVTTYTLSADGRQLTRSWNTTGPNGGGNSGSDTYTRIGD